MNIKIILLRRMLCIDKFFSIFTASNKCTNNKYRFSYATKEDTTCSLFRRRVGRV